MHLKLMSLLLAASLLICGVLPAFADTFEYHAPATIQLQGFSELRGYEYVLMGYYPYSSTGTPEPILWRVLSVEGDVALLRSEYALDSRTGNRYSDAASLPASITDMLKKQPAVIKSSVLSVYDLSLDMYGFGSTSSVVAARRVVATPYAVANGVPVENGYASYWTHDGGSAAYVTPNGGTISVIRTMEHGVVPSVTVSVNKLGLDTGNGTFENPYYCKAAIQDQWVKTTSNLNFGTEIFYLNKPTKKGIDVYTGPGTDYYQPYGATINTRSTKVTLLASEGAWSLIEYKVGSKGTKTKYKTGYIYQPGLPKYAEATAVSNFNATAYTQKDVKLYDDRNLVSQPLYTLPANTPVHYLGYTIHNKIELAYIETEVYGKPARGFVRLNSLYFAD